MCRLPALLAGEFLRRGRIVLRVVRRIGSRFEEVKQFELVSISFIYHECGDEMCGG
jgi:hypothetical protein